MNNILLGVIAVSVLVMAIYVVPLLIELKKTVISLRNTAESKINPALEELQLVLKDMHDISGNVSGVTSDVRAFSASVGDLGRKINVVNELIGSAGASTAIRALSLRTGLKTAIQYLILNFRMKGEGK